MQPEYERFIEEYRARLHAESDILADMLDDALRRVYATGCDTPQAIENWDAFMELVSSDKPWQVKWDGYGKLLRDKLEFRVPERHR